MTLTVDGMKIEGTADEVSVLVERLTRRHEVYVAPQGIPIPGVSFPDGGSITIDRRVGDPPGWLSNGPTCAARADQ